LGDIAFGIANAELNGAYETQAQLGLGLNSSLLHQLKDAGKIGSRSYSVHEGRSGRDPTQGSLVLGGVDQALIGNGNNFSRKLIFEYDCDSGIKVTFTDLVLNFRDGSNKSLFEGSSAGLQACLKPSFPGLMTLPRNLWEKFRDLTETSDEENRAFDTNYRSILLDAGTA